MAHGFMLIIMILDVWPSNEGVKNELKAESAAVDLDFEFKKPVIHIVKKSTSEFCVKCTTFLIQ
jgi:hypothetical protein